VTEAISVIIPAWNSALTIARAIASTLRQPEVAEVVVVDDGSTDDTVDKARSVAGNTGRLRIIRLPANRGPAFARNCAIENSSAPLIALLDADDFFIEGRFRSMLDGNDWDFAADNIVFIDERFAELEPRFPSFLPEPFFLDFISFVKGCTAASGNCNAELAFLHPVIRRTFLSSHQLRYNPALRLGEDYDLYARALAQGARFKVVRTCGYGAIVRPDSLSRRHSTDDLKRFCDVDDVVAELCAPEELNAVREHQRFVRARYELRRFLDIKSSAGIVAAISYGVRNTGALPAIIRGIARDKLEALLEPTDRPNPPRYLLPGTFAEETCVGTFSSTSRKQAAA